MLEKSILFKRLKKLEKKEFDSDSSPVSSKITEELLKQTRDILSRISQYLPDYTLHDIQHSCRVLENIESIIPPSEKLNIVEIKVLIYTVFLHDIGMTSDKIEEELFNDYFNEKEDKEKEKLFKDYIQQIKKKNTLDSNLIEDFSKLLNEELINYKGSDYSEYIRVNHVRRSKMKLLLLKKNMDFEYKGVCLLNHIYDVILSHGLNFKDLEDENRYPIEEIISNKKVNILFISTLLRVGDLLDADISRTPKYVYDFFQFKDKKSELKWEKNLSLVGKQITNYNVSFNYMSTSPEQERDIRRYIEFVEKQILNTNKVLKYSSKKLNLSPIINLTVRNNGSYKSADKKITIEYDKVKKILMGLELYDNETMFLRELIQNARDACKMREFYCKKLNIKYTPKIVVSYDEEKRQLVVKDNGIGMNDEKINNFFIKIGNSSYSDENFYEKYKFHPIGHFGIGIFSAFMASDEIDVNSIRFKEDGFFDEPVNIKLKIDEKYVIDLETDKNAHEGTQISMRLNDSVKKLDKEFIVKKIKDTVSDFFDINIYFNNLQNQIYKTKKKIPNNYIVLDKKDYTLKFEFEKNLYYDDSHYINLSHNGIIIDHRFNDNNLFIFTSFKIKNISLEIKGYVKLSLKASRDNIIQNNISNKLFNKINVDIFNYILKNNKEKYLFSEVNFRGTSDIDLAKSFIQQIKLKTYTKNAINKISIRKIINSYNVIYIFDKINIKDTSLVINKINNKTLILNASDKYVTSITNILTEYIKDIEIKLYNNSILYEKISLNSYKEDRKKLTIWKDRIFVKFDNKQVLFLIEDFNSPDFQINKNHNIGKLIYKNKKLLSFKNRSFLYNDEYKKSYERTYKKYKKSIPKKYSCNFVESLISDKQIKYMNKNFKVLTDKLKIKEYEVTKKDFLKSVFKIKNTK